MSTSKQESRDLPKKSSFVNKLKSTIEFSSSATFELDNLLSLSTSSLETILTLSHDEFISQTPEQLSLIYNEIAQKHKEIILKSETLRQEKSSSTISNSNALLFTKSEPVIETNTPLNKVKQFLLTNAPKKIILLVDDTILQLKGLAHAIKNKINHNHITKNVLKGITSQQWIIDQAHTELFNDWGIIYAANGEIALEIVNLGYPIKALITDQNMPQKKLQGIDLIREVVKTHSFDIALHTSDPITEFNEEQRAVLEQNNITFIEKLNKSQIHDFITKALDLMADDNKEKPQTTMRLF